MLLHILFDTLKVHDKTMNTMKLVMSMTLVLLTLSGTVSAQQSFQVSPEKSSIKWVGKKVTGQHNGSIGLSGGTLEVDDKTIKGGEFTIDMTSITVLDLTGDMKGKLEGHLNSDDFFSVAKFPAASFKITKAVATDSKDANYEITGDLTIKGITNPITFPAKVVLTKAGFITSGKFTIDRTKWDVRYGSGSFFEGLGDKTIYDDIELELYVVSK